ncbi:3-hydroxyacyl-CoA dehydrogenase NAD-binding domain-containing protein [Oleomonas cavernae]|uniref:3-hydroxyacyl-CoA dehydrogenase NAD-binding domain-containing protein n=1 Tax=Oleomonas cavernae TaxID=2320859 RepID=UPI001F1A0556|nr:3-hydroxyacyl-CoA dehydrogenase NAD-binding domain-containing protein [Oleomonas cavernae]
MTIPSSLTIGVVGAGTMGRGIVQLFAQAGHRVIAVDAVAGAAEAAVAGVADTLDLLVRKGRLSEDARRDAVARMMAAPALAALGACDVVIEAIVEDLGAKRALFHALEAVVSPDAVLASNTSSLTVSEIAAGCAVPARVAGLHFFNPVPLMKVVEVIAAVRTAPAVVTRLCDLVAGTGHRAVVAADQPGFLVNHAGRGLYTEGLRIVEEQAASPATVDLILREAAGFRMGPFELMDLTGLDVSGKVMASIYEQFQQEPRYRPSSLVPPRIAGGLYGRKTGEGWYRYEDGKPLLPSRPVVPVVPTGITVWIDPDADDREALATLVAGAGCELVARPRDAALLLIQPWGLDATGAALAGGWMPPAVSRWIRCRGSTGTAPSC